MGYFRHHAIIVTTAGLEAIATAHEKAFLRFHGRVSPIVASQMNGFYSFFIPPDGSKELWPESDHGDRRRAKSLDWLGRQRYADGGSPYHYVEIEYGDESRQPSRIIADSQPARPSEQDPADREIPF